MSVLKMFDEDLFQIHSTKGIFRGNRSQVTTYAMLELGIEFLELEDAIEEMQRKGDDGAEFGALKRFIFTFNSTNKAGFN